MKKLNCSSIVSFAFVKNSLRRLIPLIVASLIGCFISITLPALIIGYGPDMVPSYLNEYGIYTKLIATFLGGITPVILFSSLHKKNSVNFHFSIPLTRVQIFISYLVVSLVVMVIPLLYNFANFAVLGFAKEGFDIVVVAAVTGLFVNAVSFFAGIVTGSNVVHFVCAVWFNFIAHTIFLIALLYSDFFLIGFSDTTFEEIIYKCSPFTFDFDANTSFTIVYFAIAVLIFAVSLLLFKKLKLERAEQGMTFKSISIVLNVIIAVYGSVLLSILLYDISKTMTMFIFGNILGCLIGTYAGFMFLNKSSKIFAKGTFKVLIVSVVISLLFSFSFIFDIYGFSSKVPKVSEVKKVTLNVYSEEFEDENNSIAITENLNKQRVLTFHEELIKVSEDVDNLNSEEYWTYSDGAFDEVQLVYELSNGDVMYRSYYVPVNVEKYIKDIVNSKEYKEQNMIDLSTVDIKDITVYSNVENDGGSIISSKEKIKKIVDALNKDIANRTFEDYSVQNQKLLYQLEIRGTEKKNQSDKNSDLYLNRFIIEKDINVKKVLKDLNKIYL